MFHAFGAEIGQPLLHSLLIESFAQGVGKLLDHRMWGAAWYEHRVKRGNIEFGQALLVGGWYIGQQRAAFLRGDGQRLDVACLHLAQRSKHGIAFIVDLTRQHGIQYRGCAGKRNHGRLDANRRVKKQTTDIGH